MLSRNKWFDTDVATAFGHVPVNGPKLYRTFMTVQGQRVTHVLGGERTRADLQAEADGRNSRKLLDDDVLYYVSENPIQYTD